MGVLWLFTNTQVNIVRVLQWLRVFSLWLFSLLFTRERSGPGVRWIQDMHLFRFLCLGCENNLCATYNQINYNILGVFLKISSRLLFLVLKCVTMFFFNYYFFIFIFCALLCRLLMTFFMQSDGERHWQISAAVSILLSSSVSIE